MCIADANPYPHLNSPRIAQLEAEKKRFRVRIDKLESQWREKDQDQIKAKRSLQIDRLRQLVGTKASISSFRRNEITPAFRQNFDRSTTISGSHNLRRWQASKLAVGLDSSRELLPRAGRHDTNLVSR